MNPIPFRFITGLTVTGIITTVLMISSCNINRPVRCGGQQEGTWIKESSQVIARFCQTYTKEVGRLLTQKQLVMRTREQLQAAIQTEISGKTHYEVICNTSQADESCQTHFEQQINTYVKGVLSHVTKLLSDPTGDCTCVTLSTQLQPLHISPPSDNPDRDDVYQAQIKLSKLRYQPGRIDGLMGANTTAAIKQFQSNNGLPITGKLDEKTRQELQVEYDKLTTSRAERAGSDTMGNQPRTIRVNYPKTLIYDLFLIEQNGSEIPTGFKNTVSIVRGANGKVTARVVMGQGANRMQFQSIIDSQNRLIMSSVRDMDGFHSLVRSNKAGLVPGVPLYQYKSSSSNGVTNWQLDDYRPVDLYGLIILSLTKHVVQDYRKSETLRLFVGRNTTLVSLVGKGVSFRDRNNRDCHQFLVKDQAGTDSLQLTVCTDSGGYTFPTDIQFLKDVFTAGKIHWKLSRLVK
jgi:hypothetical protein